MKTRFTCRRRRCLPPSSPFVQKGRKPSPGPNSPIGTWPGPSPTNADNSLHAYKVPRSDHYRRGGVTVPRATRCNRRVAPGRLSPAAPSGRGHSDPAAGVWVGRALSRARTCAHRRARRPRSARVRPRRQRRPPSASAAPRVLRRPRHRRRRVPVVQHPLRLRWSRP